MHLHGVPIGLAVLIGLVITISTINLILLATTGSARALRFNRWGWIALTAAALAASGTSIGTVN